MRYNKPVLTLDEQISLLRERGLVINDDRRAKKYLTTVGYFRLSGYMFHLQSTDGNHMFIQDTNFDKIITLYQFDKKLRNLIYEYIERIEVAMRSLLSNKFSYRHGFFWYTDHKLYADQNAHSTIVNYVAESFSKATELYLRRFQHKYTSERFPPSNMAMEILTFGKIARLYAGLSNGDEKRDIADSFGLTSIILSSWVTYIANVRNICAHHSRLWNKKVTADRFKIPTREKFKFRGSIPNDFNTTLYGIISVINRLLCPINAHNNFIPKIESLIESYPEISTADMGFPDNWRDNATWKGLAEL